MKIGLTGTHSTGKTTLVGALLSEKYFDGYYADTNSTRWIKDIGFTINQEGDSISQELIMMRRVATLFTKPRMIADRTVIDVMSYTAAGYEDGRISDETYHKNLEYMRASIDEYTHIFWLQPEFDIVEDGVRSNDISYRDTIANNIAHLVSQYQINGGTTPITVLTGSVRERVTQVLTALGAL